MPSLKEKNKTAHHILKAFLKENKFVLNEKKFRFESERFGSIDALEIYCVNSVKRARDLIEAIYEARYL